MNLAEQIAREHSRVTAAGVCLCGAEDIGFEVGYAAHIATVTEQAVRERVAAELVDTQGALAEYLTAWAVGGARVWAETPTEAAADILDRLARIARGGTHA